MPNFGHMVESVRAVAEADIFKAATQPELDKRKAEYEVIQRKEQERIQKEREEEIAALGLSPQYQKIKALAPVVQDLLKEYQDDQADWIGNYSDFSYDNPVKLSFNIKIYGISIPDWARDKLGQMNLEDTSEDYFQQYMADQLESFAEGLQEEYDFIEDWFQEGRSGGWLILKVDPVVNDDLLTVLEIFSETPVEDEDWFTPQGLKDAYNILKESKKALDNRIRAYQQIANKVEKGRKAVKEYASSDEYWKEFFSAYDKEPAEKAE